MSLPGKRVKAKKGSKKAAAAAAASRLQKGSLVTDSGSDSTITRTEHFVALVLL